MCCQSDGKEVTSLPPKVVDSAGIITMNAIQFMTSEIVEMKHFDHLNTSASYLTTLCDLSNPTYRNVAGIDVIGAWLIIDERELHS